MDLQDVLDEQFDRAWDAGVLAAFDVVADMIEQQQELLEAIKQRFVDELEMKEDE